MHGLRSMGFEGLMAEMFPTRESPTADTFQRIGGLGENRERGGRREGGDWGGRDSIDEKLCAQIGRSSVHLVPRLINS